MRKLLLSAILSMAGLVFAGPFVRAEPVPAVPQAAQQSQRQDQQTKSVSGTVVSIGNQGRSFALEVDDGGTK